MSNEKRDTKLQEIDAKKELIHEKLKRAKERANRRLKMRERLSFKISFIVVSLVFVVSMGLTVLNARMATKGVQASLEKSLVPAAQLAADMIGGDIDKLVALGESVASSPIMNGPNVSEESRNYLFKEYKDETGAIRCNGFDLNGVGNGMTVTGDMLNSVRQGESYVSSPGILLMTHLIGHFNIHLLSTNFIKPKLKTVCKYANIESCECGFVEFSLWLRLL